MYDRASTPLTFHPLHFKNFHNARQFYIFVIPSAGSDSSTPLTFHAVHLIRNLLASKILAIAQNILFHCGTGVSPVHDLWHGRLARTSSAVKIFVG